MCRFISDSLAIFTFQSKGKFIMSRKPDLSFRKIWDLNFGYLGLQICSSLFIANTSRILSALGADTANLAFLWLVAPLAGLILQPIIGYFSDKTWSPLLGRRIPYIFVGGAVTALMMILMPNSYLISRIVPPVFAGVSILFLIQSSLNLAMQPYRSLVGDMVNKRQGNLGYSVQTFFTNLGGIVGSFLPFVLVFWGVGNQVEGDNPIVDSVKWSFYIGAVLLFVTNLWTCFNVKEYPPKLFEEYNKPQSENLTATRDEDKKNRNITPVVIQLFAVQFFSWFAFYYIWVYTTDGIARSVWNTSDPYSQGYNDAANWFGVLSGIYSLIAALFSIFIPRLIGKTSRKSLYALSLFLGGASLFSIYVIDSQYLLLVPMIGIGIAWAMILTVPFAILSSVIPAKKMGLYMGLFNVTIVFPQIVAGLTGNLIFSRVAGESAIAMMIVAGISLILGGIAVFFIKE